jgi:SAM-dependent methyltransferase
MTNPNMPGRKMEVDFNISQERLDEIAYHRSARLYDKMYGGKDYDAEAQTLQRMIAARATRPYKSLLDVGCGTGAHLVPLQGVYECAGVDYSEAMLEIAREKLPQIPFTAGDMRTFDLGRPFDIVTCLFSAIGYMKTVDDLNAAVANMARHVAPGGLLVFEGWFPPGGFNPSHLAMLTVDEPTFKLARTNRNIVRGRVSIMEMHHLVNTPDGIDYFIERHELGLFSKAEYMDAITRAGLRADVDPQGLIGRGLYFGMRDGA